MKDDWNAAQKSYKETEEDWRKAQKYYRSANRAATLQLVCSILMLIIVILRILAKILPA